MSLIAQGPLYLVSFLLIISVVVVIHELGHYLAGRWFGAAAESFSVGFGKPLVERTDKRGTRWRVNWIPLGGFVKFVDEHPEPSGGEGTPQGLAYPELSVGQRSVVAVAGPFANFLFASVVFGIITFWIGIETHRVVVSEVMPGGAGEQAGFLSGDQMVSVNGRTIEQSQDVILATQFSAGTPVEFEIIRDGAPMSITAVPERVEITDDFGVQRKIGRINISLGREVIEERRVDPVTALAHGVGDTWRTLSLTFRLISRMLQGKESLDQLSGPVGIAKVAGSGTVQIVGAEAASTWEKSRALILWFLGISASISVAVGVFNLLPIPVLDGGHLVFNAYEAVTGSQPSEKVQQACLSAGLFLLVSVAVFVTWNDIQNTGLLEVFSGL